MVLDSDSDHIWYRSSTTMVPPPKGPTDFWWPGQPGGPWNEPKDEPLWNLRGGGDLHLPKWIYDKLMDHDGPYLEEKNWGKHFDKKPDLITLY